MYVTFFRSSSIRRRQHGKILPKISQAITSQGWLSAIFVKRSQVVLRVKKAKSRWIQLKFPSLNLKDDSFHSHFSRHLHYCRAGLSQFQKAQ